MPLPADNIDWPPRQVKEPNRLVERWAAWYAGDPDELARVYADTISTGAPTDLKRVASDITGSIAGHQTRMWWGRPATPGTLAESRLHVPLAGDIAVTSADLLFGEPPALVVEESQPTQDRLDLLMGEALSALLEGAEIAAALGGVYLRVGWDEQISDRPIFDAIPPDAAIPEWRSGRLTAVTFWRELSTDGGPTLRHLERHEPGRLWHALYAGTPEKLGRRVPLTDHPDTAVHADLVDGDGGAATGATGLCVEYIPNMRPNRILRGSPLGRSDYAGIEPLLDALDEAWSSWMRDIRLGKARLVVPEVYLQSDGRGRGARFDSERAVYESVDALPGSEGLSIQPVQFAIRVVEHRDTCAELTAQALRGAGYATQTFGEAGEVAATATEVVARERRSYTTRARKIQYARGPLERLFETALQIDTVIFKPAGVTPIRPTVEWPDGVATDPEALARTLQMLHAAEAVSTRMRVQMLHPDWDDTAIDEEVDRLGEDAKAGMPELPLPGAAGNGPIPTGPDDDDDE